MCCVLRMPLIPFINSCGLGIYFSFFQRRNVKQFNLFLSLWRTEQTHWFGNQLDQGCILLSLVIGLLSPLGRKGLGTNHPALSKSLLVFGSQFGKWQLPQKSNTFCVERVRTSWLQKSISTSATAPNLGSAPSA